MIIQDLLDFIDAAVKSRKYPRSTAAAKRSALRLFSAELNEDEAKSLESFEKNFGSIYQEVFNKNKSAMSANSLVTYKRRVSGLIRDYKKYGLDPTKMANWSRPVRRTTPRVAGKESPDKQAAKRIDAHDQADVYRFELPLREGVKAIISTPKDITKKEIQKIKKYVDFLDSISEPSLDKDKEI